MMVFMRFAHVEHNSHIFTDDGLRSEKLFVVFCLLLHWIYVGPGDRFVCLLHLLVMELGQTLTAKIHKYFPKLRGVNR